MGVIANALLRSSLAPRIGLLLGPGPFMTALNMNGFSLSLIRLDAARELALTAPVGPAAWTGMVAPAPVAVVPQPGGEAGEDAPPSEAPALAAAIRAACDRLIALEDALNRLDARAGDGDTGSTAAAGARSIVAALPRLPLADPAATCRRIGDLLSASMGGSSGVLLSIFFTAVGQKLGEKLDGGASVPDALDEGLSRIRFYGGASPGDRTLIDALAPAIAALRTGGLAAAAAAAAQGAAATSGMRSARAGRAAYLGGSDLSGAPDAGAEAVAAVFRAVARPD